MATQNSKEIYGVRYPDGGIVAYGSVLRCAEIKACTPGAFVVFLVPAGHWVVVA